jgi:hypothetical protein
MALCVDRKKLLGRGSVRFQVHKLVTQPAFVQMTIQPTQPIRALWMPRGRHMLKKDITGNIPDAFRAQ